MSWKKPSGCATNACVELDLSDPERIRIRDRFQRHGLVLRREEWLAVVAEINRTPYEVRPRNADLYMIILSPTSSRKVVITYYRDDMVSFYKDGARRGPLVFSSMEWRAFLSALDSGEFELAN